MSSILLSQKHRAYSDMPSDARHSANVATSFPRSSTLEHGTTIVQNNHDNAFWLCDPGRPTRTQNARFWHFLAIRFGRAPRSERPAIPNPERSCRPPASSLGVIRYGVIDAVACCHRVCRMKRAAVFGNAGAGKSTNMGAHPKIELCRGRHRDDGSI
jgi:hypothetical protein